MAELAAVKSEIKAWERAFKNSKGHEPSISEIKQLPDIAAKYKLYKKLTKLNSRSSTPPAPASSSKLLLLNPRSAQTTAPLSSFNPFSPQKNKSANKSSSSSSRAKPLPPAFASLPRTNLFATPTKKSAKKTRDLSPDPFPLLDDIPQPQFQPILATVTKETTTTTTTAAFPSSAITRARKRLRGELVSPSPNKDKRRRLESKRPKYNANNSEDEDVEMEDAPDNASFLDDSPVKQPAGGRSFKLLFDEAGPSRQPTRDVKQNPVTRTKSGLFGDRVVLPEMLKPSRVVPAKRLSDDLFAPDRRSSAANNPPNDKDKSHSTSSNNEEDTPELTTQPIVLIPPSPPPRDDSNSGPGYGKYNKYNPNAKGKGKEKASKANTNSAPADKDHGQYDDDNESSIKLKIVPSVRTVATDDAVTDEDDDPIFRFGRAGARPFDEARDGNFDSDDDEYDQEGHEQHDRARRDLSDLGQGTLSVSVPDALLGVLAISNPAPKPAARDASEQVVRGLFTGRRQVRYDPSKGGEVWGVGEEEGNDDSGEFDVLSTRRRAAADRLSEDDWEDEGIPWEIGEM